MLCTGPSTRFGPRAAFGANPRPGPAPEDSHLIGFNLTVEYDGKRLGGTNIQAVLGAPEQPRQGLNEEAAVWLESGWWVALRNQFALAPCEATEILESVADELSAITTEANRARGSQCDELWKKLVGMAFVGEGPAYWP